MLRMCRQVMPYAAYAGALCLDGPTLTNLELLESSAGSSEGSLLACLDSCASAGVHLPVMTHVLPCHLLPLSMPWELEVYQYTWGLAAKCGWCASYQVRGVLFLFVCLEYPAGRTLPTGDPNLLTAV